MDNKGKRETGELASVWYGEPYEDRDEDAVDIRPRRARRSVSDPTHAGGSASGGAGAGRTTGTARVPGAAGASGSDRAAGAPGVGGTSGSQRPVMRPTVQTAQRTRPASQRSAEQGTSQRTAPQPLRTLSSSLETAASAHTDQSDSRAAAMQRTAPQEALPGSAEGHAAAPQGAAKPQNADALSETNGVLRRTSIPTERMQNVRSIPSTAERRTSGGTGTSGGSGGARTPGSSGGSRNSGARRAQRRRKQKMTVGCVIRRVLLVLLTAVVFAVGALFAVANTLANGPSETARSKAVMSAMQASAVKWLPGLFLSDEVVDKIIADSKVVVTDVRPITDVSDGDDTHTVITEDRWEKAIDGMIYENVNGKTFKGYVLLIKDPSRISVAISNESFTYASRIFEIADQYGAVAAINGGEFPDNGVVTGANPMGLTYSGGRCVWDDGLRRTFIGFTKDNKLYVEEGTTREQADAAGVRDAVAFQNGNTLITNDGTNVTYYYADSNTGVAQRTGIGQLADGTVMFLVTDGRTASSMGATKNDIIDTFAKYGAITAGLLDGGSSSMLYYRDWYDKYNVDKSQLDEWQQMGLVNRYKAFTNPRAIPTFFIVK